MQPLSFRKKTLKYNFWILGNIYYPENVNSFTRIYNYHLSNHGTAAQQKREKNPLFKATQVRVLKNHFKIVLHVIVQ